MLVIGDALDAFYLGSFLFGLLFSALSHLFGLAHVGAHLPKAFHGHGHGSDGGVAGGHPGGHRAAGGFALAGLINPASVLVFVSWFGGIGYQARHALNLVTPANIAWGLAGGTIGTAVVWWFVAKIILPNDRALDPEDYRLPGTDGRVASTIRPGGTGEIVYEQAGVRQVAAARAADGAGLGRGTRVVIVAQERGVALVEPAQDQAATPGGADTDLIVTTWGEEHPARGSRRNLTNGLQLVARRR